jgi:hypothetical protein
LDDMIYLLWLLLLIDHCVHAWFTYPIICWAEK